MKMLIALGLLAIAGTAGAETLALLPTAGFGDTHQYHGIQTDAPPTTVTIYISQVSTYNPTIELWFNDFVAGNQFFGIYSRDNQMTLTNPVTLQTIVVQLTETTRRVYIGSGRGQHSATRWTLQSGTVTR